ncbi:PREDICTED: nuclear transcription factor Y subunit gamma isoform X1 [Capra hircus]|uniref:nuclear transcription factor Y subunit gamma isoform X1 n=1 Tax=Capra hircus TaxID=9925 RepID=UPI000847C595|nr:PREDICTED: nuclear transcription factor Y subunit gamma isoform X1 [Capra hircus]
MAQVSPSRRPFSILARLQATKLLRIKDTRSLGAKAPREGEGKRGETVQTAWPPSCLYPGLARAPFSVTHASPSPPSCPGLCIAGLRRSAGAAPALPWTSEPRRKDFRVQELPLARIKKIMKLDEDVKMISAEAPVLFAKAAQIFITELTLRAWIHTEDNKRRTLQRNDIAMAITKFDQFDFLIDIVPRDELKPPKRQEEVRQSVTPAEPVQYYFTLAQQPTAVQVQGQQQGQQTTSSTTTIQPGQIIIAQPQQGQTTPVTMQVGEGQQVQIVQAQPQGQAQQAQSGAGQTMQVMQQIITNTGEIQQIPVQLNAGQLQYIRLAQPVSGTQVVQGQIQTLATNAQQITQTEVQQGQQQFSQFTDGQQLYQIQQVTMPAGQDLAQPMFIQSANQPSDGQAPQVTGD